VCSSDLIFVQEIIKSRLRIGIVSAAPNYEHKFIKHLLSASPQFELFSFIVIRKKQISTFPLDSMDIVILQNFPTSNSSAKEFNRVKRLLDSKIGLITFIDQSTDISKLKQLNKVFDGIEFIPNRTPLDYQLVPMGNSAHNILRLFEENSFNTSFWSEIPPIRAKYNLSISGDKYKPMLEIVDGSLASLPGVVYLETDLEKVIVLNGSGFWKWYFTLSSENPHKNGYKTLLWNMASWVGNKRSNKPVVLEVNKNIINPASLTVHADFYAVVLQHVREVFTGKLTALVAVEYLRCAVVCQRFFQRLNTRSGIQRVG